MVSKILPPTANIKKKARPYLAIIHIGKGKPQA